MSTRIKLEECSTNNDYAWEADKRILEMQWKSVDLNEKPLVVPEWSVDFKKEMEDKVIDRIERKKDPRLGKQIVEGQKKYPSEKTEEQIRNEKTINRANSVYGVLRYAPQKDDHISSTSFILVAERYPREEIEGIPEAELTGMKEKRKREGELTTEEIRRWKRLSRREAVYSLTPENYEKMKRRLARGYQDRNPNLEQIRSRRPEEQSKRSIRD